MFPVSNIWACIWPLYMLSVSLVRCENEALEFQKKFEIANVSSIPTTDDASESLRSFGKLLEHKIQMLYFAIFSTFAFFVNRSRAHENTPLLIHLNIKYNTYYTSKFNFFFFL